MAGEKVCVIAEAEWDALIGLPYLQQRLYMVLRWYMDIASRRVGIKRGISLQGLCEELYVEPAPGRVDSGSPSKKSVRSALLQLEKHGLIEPCGNGEVLAFLLPKAGGNSVREKTKGHKRGTVSGHTKGHDQTESQQGFPDEKGHTNGHGVNGLKGHTSGVRVNNLSVETSSSSECWVVDKKLSTGAPVLMMDDLSIVEWIKAMERMRGKVARVHASDVRAAGWVDHGVSSEDIADAYATAVQARKADQNHSPVNVRYIDSILRSTLSRRQSAVREGGRSAPVGISAFAQSEAAAIRMGVAGPGVGETAGAFISRIAAEHEARRLAVPGQQEGESVVEFMARLSAARSAKRKAM